MKTKYILLILFLIVAGAQLYVPSSMILDQEDIIASGTTFKFRTAPVDPTDPMRGKYVTLRFKDNRFVLPDSIHYSRNQEVYVEIENDMDGYAEIKDVLITPPESGSDYIKATLRNPTYFDDSTQLWIEYPFNRFYMEENKAPEAERIYNDGQIDFNQVSWAVVKVKDGEAALEDVMIDGVSIVDIVNDRQEE